MRKFDKTNPESFNWRDDQYFIVDKNVINKALKALDLKNNDELVELGAGIGSVAEHIKKPNKFSLVELDGNLCEILDEKCPDQNIFQEDALKHLDNHKYNKILSNLPYFLSKQIFEKLVKIDFEIAVVIVPANFAFEKYEKDLNIEKVCLVECEKYSFPAPFDSIYLKITKK